MRFDPHRFDIQMGHISSEKQMTVILFMEQIFYDGVCEFLDSSLFRYDWIESLRSPTAQFD